MAIFFFGGVQLLFLGIIGEYIIAIFNQVRRRPIVFERERINFCNWSYAATSVATARRGSAETWIACRIPSGSDCIEPGDVCHNRGDIDHLHANVVLALRELMPVVARRTG